MGLAICTAYASTFASWGFLVLSSGTRALGTVVPTWWSWPPPPLELVDRLVVVDPASSTGCEWGDEAANENCVQTSVSAGDGGVLGTVTLSKASSGSLWLLTHAAPGETDGA
jgi:hypothetical protein